MTMTRTTIPDMRGRPLPNLEAHGLGRKMKPLAALIDEQARLRQRLSELGSEQQRLKEEIKQAEYQRSAEWGRAIRAGEEAPSDEGIEAAKKRLEAVTNEITALRHAGDLADAELRQAVAEHREEYDALVQAKGESILAEAQEIAGALSRKLSETEGLVGVHTWLRSSGASYTPATPAAVSIDNLLHERMRDLGLLDVGVAR
jgi:chromosome segregation ATPase